MSEERTNNIQQYRHSVKLSTNAKGIVQVDVHIYSNSSEEARLEIVRLYLDTIRDLEAKGVRVAKWSDN